MKQLSQEGMEVKFTVPRFFSETRFPNFSAIVLKGFVENYPAIIRAIVEVQERGMAPGATENEKKKKDKSAGLQCQIYSLKFALSVVVLADCYSLFSKTVNILQKVNMLPHVKFDIFEGCRKELADMSLFVKLEDCPACALLVQPGSSREAQADPEEGSSGDSDIAEIQDSSLHMLGSGEGGSEAALRGGEVECREMWQEMEQGSCPGAAGEAGEGLGSVPEKRVKATAPDPPKCKWPLLHKSLIEYRDCGTFRHVQMGSLAADPLRPGTRSARGKERDIQLLGVEGILRNVFKRGQDVVDYLHRGLYKVYNAKDRELIGSIRVVLDLEKRVQEPGMNIQQIKK